MELIEVTEVGELRDHGEITQASVSDLIRRSPESLVWTTEMRDGGPPDSVCGGWSECGLGAAFAPPESQLKG